MTFKNVCFIGFICWAPGAQRDKYKTVLLLRRLGRARKQIIECEHLISVTCDRHTGTIDSENLKQIFLQKVVAFCSLVIFYMISQGRYARYPAIKPISHNTDGNDDPPNGAIVTLIFWG